MDSNNSQQWVEESIAKLQPQAGWQPDASRALAHFNVRRSAGLAPEVRLRAWPFGAAVAAAACACLLAFPTSRDLVQRLWLGHSDSRMVYVGQVYADLKTLKDKQAAADFTLKDSQGHNVRLSDYRGKVVLLNFWATWCHGCQQEIPWLVDFDRKYRSGGLIVIGISMDDGGWPALQPYLKAKSVNYPVVIGDKRTADAYGLVAMPMTLLIDREGKISAASAGLIDKAECEKEILRLLGA